MLSGLFVTNINLPDTIYNGKVTVTTAGARVQLTSDVTNIKSGVVIKALDTNTGLIYVGDSSVAASNGYQLAAGESSFFEIVNRSLIYIDSAENGEGITYIATGAYSIVPSISSVSPVGGLPADDTKTITVTGGNFIGVSSVTIDSNPCTLVNVTSATSLTAVVPTGTVGAKTVIVTGVGGSGSLASGYTYEDAPTASGISPSSGTEDGGDSVTITGTNFVNTPFVIGVTIGGAACTGVVVASDTSIIAVTPAGSIGAEDVVVTTLSGPGTLSDGYTYTPANTKSVLFDGTTDAYSGDSTDTTVSGTAVCVSFWFKVASVAAVTGRYYLVTTWGSDSRSRCLIYAWDGGLSFQMNSSMHVAAPLLSADTWHHCVTVYHGSGGAIAHNMTLYLDGSSIADLGSGTAAMDLDEPWGLGRNLGSGSFYLNGSLDEVGIYTGAILSAANVTTIYNGGTPTDLTAGPHSANLHHYYRMGDDAGDSPSALIDQQGNIDCTGAGDPVIETDVP